MTQPPAPINRRYDSAISLVKFIATFLVLNSHMGICYAKYSALATGGAFGNSLFFFISGFTLYQSRKTNFFDYYKKRIARIYPVVIAMILLSTIVWGNNENFIQGLTHYWFINCIIVYYAIFWICRYYNIKMLYVTIVSIIISVIVFLTMYGFQCISVIYADSNFRYILYFGYMAQGAYMGMNREKYIYRWWHTIFLITSFISWYVINILFESSPFQIFSIGSLYLFSYSLYVCGKQRNVNRLVTGKYLNPIVIFCGGLCLEVYLIQKYIFTTQLNNIFPFNIPIIMILVFLSAYVLSILGKFINQTFRTEAYDWKSIIKV